MCLKTSYWISASAKLASTSVQSMFCTCRSKKLARPLWKIAHTRLHVFPTMVWYSKITRMNWKDNQDELGRWVLWWFLLWHICLCTLENTWWQQDLLSKLVVLFENMCKPPGEDDSLAPELKLFPYLAIPSSNGNYQLLVFNHLSVYS